MNNPGGRGPLLTEPDDATDRLTLLVQYPEFLQDHDVIRGDKVQAGSSKCWRED
jgi:hypothetical protein